MKAATFLYVAGGCFLIAAVHKYFHKYDWESAVTAPADAFLLCGMLLPFTARLKRP